MKKFTKIVSGLLLAVMVLSLCGFKLAAAKSSTAYPLTYTDIYKNTVTIDKEPKRIVSLSPTLTEDICSVGAFSKLVGRTDYCDYPTVVSTVASVGEVVNPNIEKIVALKPDIILASGMLSEESYKKLSGLGLKVLVIADTNNFNETYVAIEKIGTILNAQEKAKRVVDRMKYQVNLVTKLTKSAKKPVVYYVVGFGKYGDFTATGETFISDMIEMAGGINAAKDGKNWKYSVEALVKKNPDLLICSKFYDSKKGILLTPGYKDLTAVKKGKLQEIDDNLISRQGPRLADGLYALAKLIHPEIIK